MTHFVNPAIVVMAYNRPESLRRLLISIKNAVIPSGATLILSIEGGATDSVKNVVESFQLEAVNKIVIERKERLGLYEHVLACGDLTEKYDAIILLEDDLIVDRDFYLFAVSSINYYSSNDRISGISLYAQAFNEYAGAPFYPLRCGYDTYFMQVASSWGQAWTKRQWTNFRNWLRDKSHNYITSSDSVPQYLRMWSKSSWKKFYSTYIAECNLYFVYPYNTYSTNYSSVGGVHSPEASRALQVELQSQVRIDREFKFQSFNEESIIYDAFMEFDNKKLIKATLDAKFQLDSVTFDLYGTKPKKYLEKFDLVVTNKKSMEPIKIFGSDLYPHEQNVLLSRFSSENNKYELILAAPASLRDRAFNSQSLIYWNRHLTSNKKLLILLFDSIKKRLSKFSF